MTPMPRDKFLIWLEQNAPVLPLPLALEAAKAESRASLKQLIASRPHIIMSGYPGMYPEWAMLEIANRHIEPLSKRRKGTKE